MILTRPAIERQLLAPRAANVEIAGRATATAPQNMKTIPSTRNQPHFDRMDYLVWSIVGAETSAIDARLRRCSQSQPVAHH
jgi:hypothetical protein